MVGGRSGHGDGSRRRRLVTYYCPECCVNWHPFHCSDGACPECGGGTRRRPREDASPDADDRHRAVLAARIKRERSEHSHKLFDDYCVARDKQRLEEALQSTDEIDSAAIWRGLGLEPPEQHGEQDVSDAA